MTQAQLDERTKNTLRRCRDFAKEVKLREEGLHELRMQTISSPNMDGMPGGSRSVDASTRRLISIEKRERDLERDKRSLETMRRAAGSALEGLKPEQRVFYREYYIEAHKASTARVIAGISERTAMRYLQLIQENKKTGD